MKQYIFGILLLMAVFFAKVSLASFYIITIKEFIGTL